MKLLKLKMSEGHINEALEEVKSLKSKFEDLTLYNESMKSSILELLTEIKERDKEILHKINTLESIQTEAQDNSYTAKEFMDKQSEINKSQKEYLSNFINKEDFFN